MVFLHFISIARLRDFQQKEFSLLEKHELFYCQFPLLFLDLWRQNVILIFFYGSGLCVIVRVRKYIDFGQIYPENVGPNLLMSFVPLNF